MLHRILEPIFISLLYLCTSLVIWFVVLRLLRLRDKFCFFVNFGLAILIGYGLLGGVFVAWTLFFPLSKIALVIFLVIVILAGSKTLLKFFGECRAAISQKTKFLIKEKIVLILILVAFIFYAVAIFVPPYRTDALAYHLPEAMTIAQRGVLVVGGVGNFLANSPKLLETIYGAAYTFGGFVVINLIHLQIAAGLILIIYGLISKEINRFSALTSVLFIFGIYEFWTNAVNAYVDAAVSCYEFAGLLFFGLWLKNKERYFLLTSGVVYGFALSMKYLPFYSLAIVGITFIFIEFKKKESFKDWMKDVSVLVLPIILIAGFWYVKNWCVTGNPLYPFVFGHTGISDADFIAGNFAVRQFYDRNLTNYLLMPIKFFLKGFYIPIFFGSILVVVGLFVKKYSYWLRRLAFFAWLYFTVWFFVISHQLRFGMVGQLTIMVVAGIVAAYLLNTDWFKKYYKVSSVVILLVAIPVMYKILIYNNHYLLRVKSAELKYAFGVINKEQFYDTKEIGDLYRLSAFINDNYSNTGFVSLWSDSCFFLNGGNQFWPPSVFAADLASGTERRALVNYLKENNLHYMIDNSSSTVRALLEGDYYQNNPEGLRYKASVIDHVIEMEKLLPELGEKIYEKNNRIVYKIDY